MEALVNYSSASSESDEEVNATKKITIIKKLPSAISKLGERKNIEEEEQHSNASLHQNRIRRFKHERGNWATFVYVPVQENILEGIPELCEEELDSIDLESCKEFHISLSRTVVLQYHLIDNFVKALEHKVRNEVSFSVFLTQIEVYLNDDKTRTFIGFKVNSTKLIDLLYKVDVVLEDFRLQRFYEDPSFHISFAWCLGDKSELLTEHFKNPTPALSACLEKCLSNAIHVEEIQLKIGHKIYRFNLNKLL